VSQWKLDIHLRNGVARNGGEAVRIGSCQHHKRKGSYRPLKERLVDLRFVASGFGVRFHVADNANDLVPRGGRAAHIQPDLFSEPFLILQIAMHKLLVYQDHGWRVASSVSANVRPRSSGMPAVRR